MDVDAAGVAMVRGRAVAWLMLVVAVVAVGILLPTSEPQEVETKDEEDNQGTSGEAYPMDQLQVEASCFRPCTGFHFQRNWWWGRRFTHGQPDKQKDQRGEDGDRGWV